MTPSKELTSTQIANAPTFLRILAGSVDLIVCALIAGILFPLGRIMLVGIDGQFKAWYFSQEFFKRGVPEDYAKPYGSLLIRLTMFLTLYLMLVGSYHVRGDCSARGGTIGKWLFGLFVTDLDGGRISRKRAIIRFVGKTLGLFLSTLFIGFPVGLAMLLLPPEPGVSAIYGWAWAMMIFCFCYLRFTKKGGPLQDALSRTRVCRFIRSPQVP